MRTLVIGASLNPTRYSHIAIKRLVKHGQNVDALGLKEGVVAGIPIKTDTKAFTEFNHIDTVTLYLNPKRQQDYYDFIISLKPRRVIFNPGTENPIFYDMLGKNGIAVEAACTLVLLSMDQY
ncbi:CoA-binding protein [Gangjinia marincola]|uniref:CoA-binding protein n=1 Tax=Gangjinia marincola TaxID=578463 RepID=A0ABP3XUY7_9FLAO